MKFSKRIDVPYIPRPIGSQPQTETVEVEVNFEKLARQCAAKAIRNKSSMTKLAGGAIVIRHLKGGGR